MDGMGLTRRAFAQLVGVGAISALAGCAAGGSDAKQEEGATVSEETKKETGAKSADKETSTKGADVLEVFDMHADTVTRICMTDYPPYDDDEDHCVGTLLSNNGEVSADRMGAARWVQCYAIWEPDDKRKISHIDWYRKSAAWFHEQMGEHGDRFAQVRSFSEITGILDAGKVASVLTVENAACLEDGLDVVDEFAQDGVLIAGITWNSSNVLGSGNDDPNRGLTELGKSYVAALEEHDIVVDVSHLNEKGFWEVEEIATKPYIATHSNSRSVCDHLRNLTDDQFKAIANRGGLVGLNFHEDFVRNGGTLYTFDELVAHVEHWLELGGEDIIALGSDRDGADVPKWLADCGLQPYLFERFCERLGDEIARKLFFDNALRFYTSR